MGEPLIMLAKAGSSIYAVDPSIPFGSRPMREESDAAEPPVVRRKVLIVDDQKLIADSLAEILRNAGFDAVAAYDGWQALEIASRFQPDSLISDVLMPGMDGVELAIAMQQRHPSLTILLFSGQAGISDIVESGYQRGYEFELIAKPVHPKKLIDRLKER